jgi:DNA (cytosine-5)-methyltransferase 1
MPIRVVELFAGVGGFRVGLEGYPKRENSNYDVVWSNQWEPSTKRQHANEVYKNRWPNSNHSDKSIEEVIEERFDDIPDHDLLVGGFPCQDYSVATSLKNSKGLIGKKGVLWWSIYSIIKKKRANKPKYLLLENVDRLLNSPSKQRGRDFAVILSCLSEQGYAVEWRVVNAGEYNMPQKRKRVYILAYHNTTEIYNNLVQTTPENWILNEGVHATSFPVQNEVFGIREGVITSEPYIISDIFNLGEKTSPFFNSGVFIDGQFTSIKTKAIENNEVTTLGDILINEEDVPAEFYIEDSLLNETIIKNQIEREPIVLNSTLDVWKYLKGRKNEERINKLKGFKYKYAEGSMTYPDSLEKPSRTIITGEGGKAPSRFKHVIYRNGRYRRLTPIELEKLNMFPLNHTLLEGVSDTKRAFFMGNALVVGIVERLGQELSERINVDINQEEFA